MMPLGFYLLVVAFLSCSYQFASWLGPRQAMLEDEHPDWLDPITHCPLATMEPLEDYEEDCENAPEEIQKEIDENRRAWANCKDS